MDAIRKSIYCHCLVIFSALWLSNRLFADTIPVRILPLGDSITEQGEPGYRYELWKRLIDAGVAFDFVGSMKSAGDERPSQWPVYRGYTFDVDHEGHSGWTASDLVNGCDWEPQRGKLSEWLKHYSPDVVLLHIGTNDAFHMTPVSETITMISRIIDQIRFVNPNVTVFIAKIIPLCGRWEREFNAGVVALNANLEKFVKQKNSSKSPIVIVDHYSNFDPKCDTDDEIHPNANGQVKMATNWANAYLKQALYHPSKIGKSHAQFRGRNPGFCNPIR
jgi:lysophospholipase L1-like esterase